MNYKVVDNFLPAPHFQEIEGLLMGENFPWYYSNTVSGALDEDKSLYYFAHMFFRNHAVRSDYFPVLDPLIQTLNPVAINKVKANLYPNTSEPVQHGMHRDLTVPHRGFLFYVNTNNGVTILEDGTRIQSVANRALFFDSYKLHCSTSCTDKKVRVTLNVNYF